jgi:predicted dehydrogenase
LRNQGWAITSKSFKFADFAALADVDSNVLGANVEKTEKTQKKKPDSYKDYRKVLDRKDIDAVMIATPDHWHTKIAVEAMLAGKDVYCEKPLTLTIAEGKLIESARLRRSPVASADLALHPNFLSYRFQRNSIGTCGSDLPQKFRTGHCRK